jgi:cyclopropane-fatty-acyl-phospholipid synthase
LLRRLLGSESRSPWAVRFESGHTASFGVGSPQFRLAIKNREGWLAVRSLDELRVCEAYMDGYLDFEGNMRAAVAMRDLLQDQNLWITAWRRIQPLLVGRSKANETWVQNHYDSNNIQLFYIDRDYNTYTPGVFEREDETLEVASERKLRLAFEGVGLRAGDRILEVGFGWGSFLRYAARRGVHVTGLTLSRHQLAWVRKHLIENQKLDAELIYSDFFTWEPPPGLLYDAIVMVGVIEELADFDGVMRRIARWLKPGRKVYIDFVAATEHFVFPAFVSKYIYQGVTCRVYLPKFIEAVTRSPFELAAMFNDRRNYYLTARTWFERYEQNAEAVRARHGERMYRLFRMYLAGAAEMLDSPTHLTTAYRVFLELPSDYGR